MLTGYRLIGKWQDIPVFFHWTVLLWIPWFLLTYMDLAWALMAFAALVVVLLAHEMGHAYAARSRRVRVKAIRLFLTHGQCVHEVPYYERDHVFIAWGGVLAQFALLLVAGSTALALLRWAPDIYLRLEPLFYVLVRVNVFMAIFNLIPVPPLDGHLAWRGVPSLRLALVSRLGAAIARLGTWIDFRKRWALARDARAAADDLLDRLARAAYDGYADRGPADAATACNRTAWKDLYRFYAEGAVWVVSADLDLADLARKLSGSGPAGLRQWLAGGHASRVSDEQALAWHKADAELLVLMVDPYVLVKPCSPD